MYFQTVLTPAVIDLDDNECFRSFFDKSPATSVV